MGLDVGDRRIGIALSDALGITAQRLTVVERTAYAKDIAALTSLMAEHHVDALVVGLPLTMAGEVGPQARKVMRLIHGLKEATGLPVHVLDERLTTAQSQRMLITMDTSRRRRKELVDQVAAQLILQAFLDTSLDASDEPPR
jgi:putative Holliday junction resolvase